MARAIWHGIVVAESSSAVSLEGDTYFPSWSVRTELLRDSDQEPTRSWKGEARWFDLVLEGGVHRAAAWTHEDPTGDAEHIRDHVAFRRGVEIERDS